MKKIKYKPKLEKFEFAGEAGNLRVVRTVRFGDIFALEQSIRISKNIVESFKDTPAKGKAQTAERKSFLRYYEWELKELKGKLNIYKIEEKAEDKLRVKKLIKQPAEDSEESLI